MSTAVLIVAPSAVPSAAAAAPVLAAAGAAVLVVGAAVVATELAVVAVRKAAEYGEKLERAADAQARKAFDARIWGTTVAHVAELDARLTMFEARARRSGVQVAMPARLDLTGCDPIQAARWYKRTVALLEKAQMTLHSQIAERELAKAMLSLPISGSNPARAEASAVLGRYQRMMINRYPVDAVDPTAIVSALDVLVQRQVRLLDPDAHDDEHARVLAAAALVANNSGRSTQAHAFLRTLTSTVARTNSAVAERRLAAEHLNVLENQIVAGMLPHGPYTGTAAKLRSVVSADAELTDELRREAKDAVSWADIQTRRNYLMEQSRACMSEFGYDSREDIDAQGSVTLEYGKAEWGDEYRAQTWLDEHGSLHGRVLRGHAVVGDDAEALNAERCAEFVEDISRAGKQIGAEVRSAKGIQSKTDSAPSPNETAKNGRRAREAG
jgi:hypothetical protein